MSINVPITDVPQKTAEKQQQQQQQQQQPEKQSKESLLEQKQPAPEHQDTSAGVHPQVTGAEKGSVFKEQSGKETIKEQGVGKEHGKEQGKEQGKETCACKECKQSPCTCTACPGGISITPVQREISGLLKEGHGEPASSEPSTIAIHQERAAIDHSADDASRKPQAPVDYVAPEESESYKERVKEGKSRQP